METLTNFRQSTIIKNKFLKAFNDNRVNKDYWDECQKQVIPISTLNDNVKRNYVQEKKMNDLIYVALSWKIY